MVVESVLEEMSENSCLSNATVATLLEELEVRTYLLVQGP